VRPHTDPREIAILTAQKYYEREGKYPSIRTLAKEDGVSDWIARTVLKELKKHAS
jgi:DNA-binding transcriptional regulator YhcF (GntR family)